MSVAPTDERFTMPLYSVTDATLHIDVPVSTFRSWTHGYARPGRERRTVTGVVTTLPRDAGVSVPFVGLAEAHALAAIRRTGVPLQRIRPALQRLQDELGIEHVLASGSLYTDGAEVMYDFAESQGDTPEARSARDLVVVRNSQRGEIVDSYLRRVEGVPRRSPRSPQRQCLGSRERHPGTGQPRCDSDCLHPARAIRLQVHPTRIERLTLRLGGD